MMKKGESPSDFHDCLVCVQRKFPGQVTDLQIRNSMMRQCTSQYHTVVVESLRKPALEAEDLMEDMQQVFRTMQSLKFDEDSEEEVDVALVQPAQNSSHQSQTQNDHRRVPPNNDLLYVRPEGPSYSRLSNEKQVGLSSLWKDWPFSESLLVPGS